MLQRCHGRIHLSTKDFGRHAAQAGNISTLACRAARVLTLIPQCIFFRMFT
jgi:hypothetical protein